MMAVRISIFNHFRNLRYVPALTVRLGSVTNKRDFNVLIGKLVHLNNNQCINKHLIIYRNRYDDKNTKQPDSDDEEDYSNDVDKKNIVKIRVQSLRLDLLIKSALGIARNKIEGAFYENKIRLNGKKITKKSVHCNVDDVIDIIKEPNGNSDLHADHMNIARLEILDIKTDGEHIFVSFKRFKNLVVQKEDFK